MVNMAFHSIGKIFLDLVQDHSTNPVTIVYIPSHLYHIVFELLKVGFSFSSSEIDATNISRIHFVQLLNDMVWRVKPFLLYVL